MSTSIKEERHQQCIREEQATATLFVPIVCLCPMRKLRAEIIPGSKKNKSNASDENDAVPHSSASVRISWARAGDIEHCPHCGGNMKIITAILERESRNHQNSKPSCLACPSANTITREGPPGSFDPS